MDALFTSMLNTAYYTTSVVIYSKISIVSLRCQGGFGVSSRGMGGMKKIQEVAYSGKLGAKCGFWQGCDLPVALFPPLTQIADM